jgi:predicted GNAT superfamily acetyltransferase
MQQMIAAAYHAVASTDAASFIIAFDQDADYASENFLWFKSRNTRFI